MPLYNHLGSQKHIRFPFRESGQDLFKASLLLRGITVHTQHPDPRKQLIQLPLNLLGSCLEAKDIIGAAIRAAFRLNRFVPAVVAYHFPSDMLGQGHITVRTLHHIATGTARHEACIPTTV